MNRPFPKPNLRWLGRTLRGSEVYITSSLSTTHSFLPLLLLGILGECIHHRGCLVPVLGHELQHSSLPTVARGWELEEKACQVPARVLGFCLPGQQTFIRWEWHGVIWPGSCLRGRSTGVNVSGTYLSSEGIMTSFGPVGGQRRSML